MAMLQANGFAVEEVPVVSTAGEHIEMGCMVYLDPGRYLLTAQLHSFFLEDRLHSYGNNAPEEQSLPVAIDVDCGRFPEIIKAMLLDLEDRGWDPLDLSGRNAAVFVEELDHCVQNTLANRWEDDHIRRLSELLEQGVSACAGKSTLAAALVLKALGDRIPVSVQLINGHIGSLAEINGRDFSHVWTRIQFRGATVLYDPFYRKVLLFEGGNYYCGDLAAFQSRIVTLSFLIPFVNDLGADIPSPCCVVRMASLNQIGFCDENLAVQRDGALSLEITTRQADRVFLSLRGYLHGVHVPTGRLMGADFISP
jgi:hypothetical protein